MIQKIEQWFVFELWWISLQSIDAWFTKQTFRNISHLHIFVFTFGVDLMTPESLWRHEGIAMHVSHKTMHSFSSMLGSPPPAPQLRLHSGFVMYQNQTIHVIIGFKHDVPCIVGPKEPSGHSNTSMVNACLIYIKADSYKCTTLFATDLRKSSTRVFMLSPGVVI